MRRLDVRKSVSGDRIVKKRNMADCNWTRQNVPKMKFRRYD